MVSPPLTAMKRIREMSSRHQPPVRQMIREAVDPSAAHGKRCYANGRLDQQVSIDRRPTSGRKTGTRKTSPR